MDDRRNWSNGLLTADIAASGKPSDAERIARRDLVYRLLDEQLTA